MYSYTSLTLLQCSRAPPLRRKAPPPVIPALRKPISQVHSSLHITKQQAITTSSLDISLSQTPGVVQTMTRRTSRPVQALSTHPLKSCQSTGQVIKSEGICPLRQRVIEETRVCEPMF